MDKYTGTDNLEVMQEAKNYNKYLIELIKGYTNKEASILDFGAGIGTFAQDMVSQKYDVVCLETDANQCKAIEQHGIKTYQTLEHIEDKSFDFIYSLNVLEHIEDDVATLKVLKKKLKPGGLLLIYVPAFQILFSSMDEKVGHFRRYDFEGMKSLANKSDLQIKKLFYVDSLGFFITLLYKLLGSKEGNIDKKSLIFYDKVIFPISQKADFLFNKFFGKNVYIVLKK